MSISYNGKLVPHTNMLSTSDGTYVKSTSFQEGPTNQHNVAIRYKNAGGLDIGADYTSLLKPMRTYSSQLVYILKQRYVFTLFYSNTKDYFAQNSYQLPDRLALQYKYINFDYARRYGINISIPFSIQRWFNTKLNLTGMRMEEKCSEFYELSFDRGKWLGVASLDNTFKVSSRPDITLELAASYQTNRGQLFCRPLLFIFMRKYGIKSATTRLLKSRIPEFTEVNEDMRDENNAVVVLLKHILLVF